MLYVDDVSRSFCCLECWQQVPRWRCLHNKHYASELLRIGYTSLFTLLSVLSFSFICWFHSLGVKNRNSLQRIVRIASKITAVPQRDLALFCEQQILRKARSILTKKDHILNQEFTTLPSGRHLRCPICKTNRMELWRSAGSGWWFQFKHGKHNFKPGIYYSPIRSSS